MTPNPSNVAFPVHDQIGPETGKRTRIQGTSEAAPQQARTVTKCKKQVSGSGQWGAFHPHQCPRKATKDGYCTQHHPDSKKARNEEREAKWKAKRDALDRKYQRAEAAAKIVRLARQWVCLSGGQTGRIGESRLLTALTNAVDRYESLLTETDE